MYSHSVSSGRIAALPGETMHKEMIKIFLSGQKWQFQENNNPGTATVKSLLGEFLFKE